MTKMEAIEKLGKLVLRNLEEIIRLREDEGGSLTKEEEVSIKEKLRELEESIRLWNEDWGFFTAGSKEDSKEFLEEFYTVSLSLEKLGYDFSKHKIFNRFIGREKSEVKNITFSELEHEKATAILEQARKDIEALGYNTEFTNKFRNDGVGSAVENAVFSMNFYASKTAYK